MSNSVIITDSSGVSVVARRGAPAPGCFTFTYGNQSVTLDPTWPREKFAAQKEKLEALQRRAFSELCVADQGG